MLGNWSSRMWTFIVKKGVEGSSKLATLYNGGGNFEREKIYLWEKGKSLYENIAGCFGYKLIPVTQSTLSPWNWLD